MNLIERTLYKTRKSLLEACTENDIEYSHEIEICLMQCSSCGIWLFDMPRDDDGHETCQLCLDSYGR